MSALIERIIAGRDRLKMLDRSDQGYGPDVKFAREAMADAANAIQERDETIFYLRQRLSKLETALSKVSSHDR